MHATPSRRRQRPTLKPLALAVLCAVHGLMPQHAMALDAGALPTNGQITSGSGGISQAGNVLDVTQNSQQLIATWERFNIGKDAQVNFHQPNASAVALNRVTASDASQILGQLNANGQVYLINPSGVLFGNGASVNVGGLVASTLDINDDDFKAGRLRFQGDGQRGAVINQGTLRAADGGSVALLGGEVRNEGAVIARMGSVVLGGGEKMTLDYNGDGLINLQVDEAAVGASVANRGLLQADGGTVLMSARTSDAMVGSVVNNEGVIEARSLQQRNGRIVLDGGDNGVVANSGVIDASGRGAGEHGGNVTLTGEYVGLFEQGRIDASGSTGGGTVLLGGDYQGSGPLHQATATYMGEDARIEANALGDGDGGKVILWSRDSTRFEGVISATGAGAGKGGLVETSGNALDVTGLVNLAAASGQGGTWLLDPFNINITSGASNGTSSSSPFTPNAGRSSNLSSATLNASLSEGANIIVQTSSGAGTSGDINVLDNVKARGNASLTLIAHRNVNMNGTSISNADGKSLNVSMLSNFNNSGNGSIALNNATINTNGGNLTLGSAADPVNGYASTNVSNGTGVAISNGTRITTNGGDISLRGATSSTLASGASATAVNISGSTLDAGGGNINIIARQASTSGTGDAFILTGGSNLLTDGAGSIAISADNLGGGNGARVFSTSNNIAARGAGNVTLSGNAVSGFGVLVCSTAAGSTQNLSVASGTLTVKGSSASNRGLYVAASGTGAVNLRGDNGGRIVLGGDSGGSYGTALNVTGASASINLTSAGDITVEGNTTGGSTPALALIAAGNGNANTPGSRINIASSAGDVRLKADNAVINTGSGSFRALYLDASGDYSNIRVNSASGNLVLEGTSASGRGVDIAPSGRGAAIDLGSDSGDVLISGTSSNSWGGYGIFLNSTGSSRGVAITTGTGNITLRGDSVGTSDAIALGGSGTASTNRISSNGGNILLDGHFHSPNNDELDHGIALLSVTNIIQTTGSGNVSLVGRATAAGDAIDFYSSGINRLSVENGTLSLDGSAVAAHGISMLTGQTDLRATGSGSISLQGYSQQANGIHFYPSSAGSSVTIATQDGAISLNGRSDGGANGNGVFLRTGPNGVMIQSAGGDISLSGTGSNGATGITFNGSGSGANSLIAAGHGNLTLTARSDSGTALNFASGSNLLQVDDGVLLIDADSDSGAYIVHSSDSTTLTANGGAVVQRLGGLVNATLLERSSADVRGYQQKQMANANWSQVLYPDYRQTPLQPQLDQIHLDLALLGDDTLAQD